MPYQIHSYVNLLNVHSKLNFCFNHIAPVLIALTCGSINLKAIFSKLGMAYNNVYIYLLGYKKRDHSDSMMLVRKWS